jgi:hypothetical protein
MDQVMVPAQAEALKATWSWPFIFEPFASTAVMLAHAELG